MARTFASTSFSFFIGVDLTDYCTSSNVRSTITVVPEKRGSYIPGPANIVGSFSALPTWSSSSSKSFLAAPAAGLSEYSSRCTAQNVPRYLSFVSLCVWHVSLSFPKYTIVFRVVFLGLCQGGVLLEAPFEWTADDVDT